MIFNVPTRFEELTLLVKVYTHKPEKIRLKVVDANQPNTTFTDRYKTIVGYEGRAIDSIKLLEEIEKTGDVITWQDLTTSESLQAVIEEISFTRMTPPDRRFDGFGGIIEIMIRTV